QKTPDGSDKRRAIAEMQAHNQAIREAAQARATATIGRTLTEREIIRGDWLPDNRSPRQRVEEDHTYTPQPVHEPDRNYFRERQRALEDKLARTSDRRERASLKRHIDFAKVSAD